MLLRLAARITRWYTGVRLTDVHNGLRAFSRNAAAGLHVRQNRMAHASEIVEYVAQHQLRYAEVPVHVSYSAYSLAKGQSTSGAFSIVWHLVLGRLRS